MKLLTILLALLVAVLAFLLYRQQSAIRDQQNRLVDLQKQIAANSAPKTAPLEYQEKCAEQAKKFFNELGYKPKDIAVYENHLSVKLNKCFIMAELTDTTHSPTIWTHRNLFDAYEGKVYGQYAWHADPIKKYWEVPPVLCKVVLPSGEDHICKSDEEFEELIKVYLEDR